MAYTAGRSDGLNDDQLHLIFTCCHPALAPEARVALTLRKVCGLTTKEVARAFLVSSTTLAQRIVRAKAKIRNTKIFYQVPAPTELPARLETVFQVIYLVFNEGYAPAAGDHLTRPDLSAEAIRLGRLLHTLLPEPISLPTTLRMASSCDKTSPFFAARARDIGMIELIYRIGLFGYGKVCSCFTV